jgi:hypothetical protein
MQESIIKYLQEKSAPASAVEIVEKVLKIKTSDAGAADRILNGIVKDSSMVYRTQSGMLDLRSETEKNSREPQVIVLCQVTPCRIPAFFNGASLYCARWVEDREEIRLAINSNDLAGGISASASAVSFSHLTDLINNAPLIFDGFGNQLSVFKRVIAQVTGRELDNPVISLYRLAKKLFPGSVIKDAAQLSAALGEKVYQEAEPELQFRAFIEQYKRIRELYRDLGMSRIDVLQKYQTGDKIKVSFAGYAFDEMFLQGLPETPGVYIMKDVAGQVIYVGKSKNLHRRLNSYFLEMEKPGEKLEKIRDKIYEINITLTGSELEALLLEQQLIDEYHPQINKQVNVHDRVEKTGQLYERIVLLPGAEPDKMRLYFIKPDQDYMCIDLSADGSDFHDFRAGAEIFFANGAYKKTDKKLDILASWLYHNNENVNSIDIRKYANFDDVERLVKDYAASMQAEKGRIIHY